MLVVLSLLALVSTILSSSSSSPTDTGALLDLSPSGTSPLLKSSPSSTSSLPAETCEWDHDHSNPQCTNSKYTWNSAYPACTLFQNPDRSPIPCQGRTQENYCEFTGNFSNSTPPQPASWHIHVFFPNPACKNCSRDFTSESLGFTYKQAMVFRQDISEFLNFLTLNITGKAPKDPIDAALAAIDPDYSQCTDTYNIAAGAPANFHDQPCIYEVDAVKEPGPFTDPATGLGYPNYSFFLPGEYWMPGLLPMLKDWLVQIKASQYHAYDVLIHPNTGCEVRDHVETKSIQWYGKDYPLLPKVFSCHSLGCNQGCPSTAPPPANCSQTSSPKRLV